MLYAIYKETIQNDDVYEFKKKYLQNLKSLQHNNLPDMLGWGFYDTGTMCGPDYILYYLF